VLTCWAWTRTSVQVRSLAAAYYGLVRLGEPVKYASMMLEQLSSASIEQSTQNWHGPGESDCLIKTKHRDGSCG
jgi:hypothetical protein